MERVELSGKDLEGLIHALSSERRVPYLLRLQFRRDGVAWKVNEGSWSPTVGEVRTDEY